MTDGSTTARIVLSQKAVCVERAVDYTPSLPESKLGFALSTKGKSPVNGLRHPMVGETNGWYIWCGEGFSDDTEFFKPLHAAHFYEHYPEIAKFLGLPPGFRFLFTPGAVDIWFDESLLKV
jgi:hypothetical protein